MGGKWGTDHVLPHTGYATVESDAFAFYAQLCGETTDNTAYSWFDKGSVILSVEAKGLLYGDETIDVTFGGERAEVSLADYHLGGTFFHSIQREATLNKMFNTQSFLHSERTGERKGGIPVIKCVCDIEPGTSASMSWRVKGDPRTFGLETYSGRIIATFDDNGMCDE
ncbi:MAG: hypothetical protein ETSY1_43185 [Candidatus Entotheonella factor]|uniref:Uncharacterized protein n=1 Tax=Entotheonella factor TaxID=1429438 RepID=W4L5C6_ENTF1|nr:MAG: hypothetical protein ETSY1_43185 [Candidatus Entotheonella factor]